VGPIFGRSRHRIAMRYVTLPALISSPKDFFSFSWFTFHFIKLGLTVKPINDNSIDK